MTTKITLQTHNWPVGVTYFDEQSDGVDSLESTEEVPPNTVREFYIHSTRSIEFTELPASEITAPGFVSVPPTAA